MYIFEVIELADPVILTYYHLGDHHGKTLFTSAIKGCILRFQIPVLMTKRLTAYTKLVL